MRVMCGTVSSRAKSALISPAACSSSGRWCSTRCSTGVSATCVFTFSAAITRPDPSRSGAATDRMPRASCSSVSAQPRARTSRSSASRSARSGCQRGTSPDRVGSASTAATSVGSSAASSTLPSEVGRAGNRVPICTTSADDLRHGHPGHVHDVRAVELGDRAGLAGAGGQPLQVRPGHLPDAHRAHVGHAQLEHPRGQRVAGAGAPDVAQLGQGEQDAPGGRAGQPGGRGHVGQGHRRPVRGERRDHLEAARERLDEVGPGALARHGWHGTCSVSVWRTPDRIFSPATGNSAT